MAIPIKKEDAELYEIFKSYEHCVFCCKDTDMWHIKSNNPVCPDCAKKFKVSDITTKPFVS